MVGAHLARIAQRGAGAHIWHVVSHGRNSVAVGCLVVVSHMYGDWFAAKFRLRYVKNDAFHVFVTFIAIDWDLPGIYLWENHD